MIARADIACIGGVADVRMGNATMTTERSLIRILIITLSGICGRIAISPESRLTGAGQVHTIQRMIALSLCNIQGRISNRVTDQVYRYFKTDTEYVR